MTPTDATLEKVQVVLDSMNEMNKKLTGLIDLAFQKLKEEIEEDRPDKNAGYITSIKHDKLRSLLKEASMFGGQKRDGNIMTLFGYSYDADKIGSFMNDHGVIDFGTTIPRYSDGLDIDELPGGDNKKPTAYGFSFNLG